MNVITNSESIIFISLIVVRITLRALTLDTFHSIHGCAPQNPADVMTGLNAMNTSFIYADLLDFHLARRRY